MKKLGYTLPLVLFFIILSVGCMNQPSTSNPGYTVTPTVIQTATPVPSSPCITCNQTVPMNTMTSAVTPTVNPTSLIAQTPIADFNANLTSGRVPLSVRFFDTSSLAPTNWSWDFGDGNFSNETSPVHTYNIPGTYSVRLT